MRKLIWTAPRGSVYNEFQKSIWQLMRLGHQTSVQLLCLILWHKETSRYITLPWDDTKHTVIFIFSELCMWQKYYFILNKKSEFPI
jgi:hypothetical protein